MTLHQCDGDPRRVPGWATGLLFDQAEVARATCSIRVEVEVAYDVGATVSGTS